MTHAIASFSSAIPPALSSTPHFPNFKQYVLRTLSRYFPADRLAVSGQKEQEFNILSVPRVMPGDLDSR